ncbi:uncharacterized protein ABDE67_019962 [Symphorus nematophorus]
MSSEVCPFCGKTYKRLKSHLPHCKAAASSKTPPSKHDVTANQTSSQQVAALAEEEKSTERLSMAASPQSKKSKKASVVSSSVTPLQSANTSSSSLSPASPPTSTKRKKQKLSEQIKTATITSTTPQSSSLSANISKPKKKSLRALIEAANTKQVSEGSVETDPLSSRTAAQTETKTNPNKDNAHPAFLPTDAKPKGASNTKVSNTKKAAQQTISTTKDTSSSLDIKVNERLNVRNDFLVQNEEDLSVNKVFLKSGSGHQARITLQDVKATLGRTNATRQSSRPSILSRIGATEIRPGSSLSPLPTENQGDVDGGSLSSPRLFPLAPQTLPARVETSRADDVRSKEKSQLEVRKQNTADEGTKGAPLTQRRLGQVRLRELPEWLACKTPSHPREVVEMVQRGWRWYYRRYIDVKKGGVGGLGMLLAGYCVLSYIWSYPHIKRDRWRKHH